MSSMHDATGRHGGPSPDRPGAAPQSRLPPPAKDRGEGLLPAALAELGWPPGCEHELVRRVWRFSSVWRIRVPGGGTAIYKEAHRPLDREHAALRCAAAAGIPVPRVLAAVQRDGRLGMIMTDLGEPGRTADDADAAAIAAALHRCPGSEDLPVLGAAGLAAMPGRIAARARETGLPPEAPAMAGRLQAEARRLAAPAETPPFGLCHREFHPDSVIIRDGRQYVYDLARAFRGPGLIDLASWHGTVTAPDPRALAALIAAYADAGGHPSALDHRAGLPPEAWALGWHRVWACDWFCQQLAMGWADDGTLPAYAAAIVRHLDEALRLLRV